MNSGGTVSRHAIGGRWRFLVCSLSDCFQYPLDLAWVYEVETVPSRFERVRGSMLAWSASGGGAKCLYFHIPGGVDQLLLRSAGDERHFRELLQTSGTEMLP